MTPSRGNFKSNIPLMVYRILPIDLEQMEKLYIWNRWRNYRFGTGGGAKLDNGLYRAS